MDLRADVRLRVFVLFVSHFVLLSRFPGSIPGCVERRVGALLAGSPGSTVRGDRCLGWFVTGELREVLLLLSSLS